MIHSDKLLGTLSCTPMHVRCTFKLMDFKDNWICASLVKGLISSCGVIRITGNSDRGVNNFVNLLSLENPLTDFNQQGVFLKKRSPTFSEFFPF